MSASCEWFTDTGHRCGRPAKALTVHAPYATSGYQLYVCGIHRNQAIRQGHIVAELPETEVES